MADFKEFIKDYETDGDYKDQNIRSENKKTLSLMEDVRKEEKERERELLTRFADNAMTHDEFKDQESKLHQDAQSRVDALYEKLHNGIDLDQGLKTAEKTEEAEQAKDNFSNKDLSEDQIKKTDHIVDYFKVWGRPGTWELQDVVNFYGLTNPMANRVFKSLGIDEKYTKNLKYKNE